MKALLSLFVTLIFSSGALSTAALADPTSYKIGTFPVPLLVENENKGVFVDLFREIEKRTGNKFEIVLCPPNRIRDMFYNNKLIGFFPALDKTLNHAAHKSEVFFIKRIIAFVRKGSPLIRTIRELEGKTVGLTTGFTYPPEITSDKRIRPDYAPNDVLSMKKLSIGRVDVVISEEMSGINALRESGETNIDYDPDIPIFEDNVFFAFQPSEEGRVICEKFSAAIAEMKKDGSLEKMMPHHHNERGHDSQGKEK